MNNEKCCECQKPAMIRKQYISDSSYYIYYKKDENGKWIEFKEEVIEEGSLFNVFYCEDCATKLIQTT